MEKSHSLGAPMRLQHPRGSPQQQASPPRSPPERYGAGASTEGGATVDKVEVPRTPVALHVGDCLRSVPAGRGFHLGRGEKRKGHNSS